MFYHPGKEIPMAVHRDDFTLWWLEEELVWIRDLMKSWFDIKVRAMLGPEEHGVQITFRLRVFDAGARWRTDHSSSTHS